MVAAQPARVLGDAEVTLERAIQELMPPRQQLPPTTTPTGWSGLCQSRRSTAS